jgi:hypothetical protein
VSTILKALRESESGTEPDGALPESVDEARRRRRTIFAVGVGVVVAAITGTAVFFSHEAPTRAARPSAAPVAALAAPAPAPAAQTGLRPAAPVPAPPPVARVAPPRARVENDAPLDPAMPEVEAAPFASVRAPRPPAQGSVSTMTGAGPIEVASVRYSPVGSRSTVTLSVDGAAPITLRQGETVNGLEIQLILPEMVYLQQGGNVVALDVPR